MHLETTLETDAEDEKSVSHTAGLAHRVALKKQKSRQTRHLRNKGDRE